MVKLYNSGLQGKSREARGGQGNCSGEQCGGGVEGPTDPCRPNEGGNNVLTVRVAGLQEFVQTWNPSTISDGLGTCQLVYGMLILDRGRQ